MIFDGLVGGKERTAEKKTMYNDNDIAVAHRNLNDPISETRKIEGRDMSNN